MNQAILVPLKENNLAKSRLSPLLTSHERSLVAWMLLEDLIRALRPLPVPVFLVTCSARAAERGEALGWALIREDRQISESVSVDAASRQLKQMGIEAVLRLPADLPLVRTEDVAALLPASLRAPCAVLSPSRDGTGTNAILRAPPDLFPSHFGPDSFASHIREAENAGAAIQIVENPRLALDLDDAGDVAHLLSQPEEGATHRLLLDLNIRERLTRHGGTYDPNPGFIWHSGSSPRNQSGR